MLQEINCLNCNQVLQQRPEFAGQLVSCPYCSFQFVMPMHQAVATPKPPSYAARSKKNNGFLLPLFIGLGVLAGVGVIGLIITLVLLNSDSSDDVSQNDSATNSSTENSRLPNSPLGPFAPQAMGNLNPEQVAQEQKLYVEAQAQFAKRRRASEPTGVRWWPTQRTYSISFQSIDSNGGSRISIRNFKGTSDELARHLVDIRKTTPGFKLGEIHVVALEFRVTFESELAGRKRYSLERYKVRRLYTQTNNGIKFHDSPRVEYTGTRSSSQPIRGDN